MFLMFKSKCKLHGVASKVYTSFTLQATQCSLHFDKPQKSEIHSLRNSASFSFSHRAQVHPLNRALDTYIVFISGKTNAW